VVEIDTAGRRVVGSAASATGAAGTTGTAGGRPGRVITRRDEHAVPVMQVRGEVELATRPPRVDPRAVAARRSDDVGDPRSGRDMMDAGLQYRALDVDD
jgi:hypothetical protein